MKYRGFSYIMAPYESDAQLGYLYLTKHVDYVLSEDSDMFVYGVRRLVKGLKSNGSCLVADLSRCTSRNPDLKSLLALGWLIRQGRPDQGVRDGRV